MNTPIKILIVEDEMIIAANISLQLSTLGYEVIGIIPRGEEALLSIAQNQPDILLMDISLKGNIDGVQTVQIMQKDYKIPVIYLTANSDDLNFNRAKETNPYAFITKPLQRAIELTVNRLQIENSPENLLSKEKSLSLVLSDCIFVRYQDKMVKVGIKSILYIEADRNYCCIYSKDKKYLLVMTLKDMEKKLPQKHFLRVHRSFIINLSQIDEVANNYIVIGKKSIPVSKTLKEKLLIRLQTI